MYLINNNDPVPSDHECEKKLLKQLASKIVSLYCTIIYLISTGGKEIVFRNNPNTYRY